MKAKFINETKRSLSLYDRAYKITIKQLDNNPRNLRYLGKVVIPGFYITLAFNYGLGRSDEVVKGMKDAIYDFISEKIYDGVEPEFASSEAYDWWEELNDSYFKIEDRHADLKNPGYEKYLELFPKAPSPIFES